jgi:TldD protein
MGVTRLRWLAVALAAGLPVPVLAEPGALLKILSEELQRNFTALEQKADQKPYFLGYTVTELQSYQAGAILGALQSRDSSHRRILDVTVRIGSPELDNYHRLRGNPPRFPGGGVAVLEDDKAALTRQFWMTTNRVYEAGAQRLTNILTDRKVKAEEEDDSPDFSVEEPGRFTSSTPSLTFDQAAWEARVKKWSAIFKEYPRILNSSVTVSAIREAKTLANSEGTAVEHGRRYARIVINANGQTSDGMNVETGETFEAEAPEGLAGEAQVMAAVRRVASDLEDLLRAPPAEPFVGPAILSGEAAGVFFHEIFGHRVEGHRQKDEQEGQTFTKQVGEGVLPEFLSVIFDPTRKSYGDEDLYGWYDYDDEGIAVRPVKVVEEGILRTFLMSRSPIRGFEHSNGHGRRQPGAEVVSRQSNLIVESAKTVSEDRLREMLIEEVKRQGKPYGLYFRDVTGGFTFTQRQTLQAFRVIPRVVYRVYPDGRPDELIRGANIVGTPLASFAKIMATSDKAGVFNGYCGAESGRVPVAAVSPALLVSEIEIERTATAQQRPPFLPRPGGGPSGR